jgi:uncharacterized protein YutE (UPF0331/DUF86 family)
MAKEIIEKKINQVMALISRLAALLDCSLLDFKNNETVMSAAERNFQLIVDIACDINTQILLEHQESSADTYVQSFFAMAKIGVIPHALAKELAEGAKLRNILVHEYDFIESDEKFYNSAKKILPAFEEYAAILYKTIC